MAIITKTKQRVKIASDDEFKYKDVARLVDAHNHVTLEPGMLIEYQGQLFGDYRNCFVIERIVHTDSDDSFMLWITHLYDNATTGSSCWITYDTEHPNIIRVLVKEEYLALAWGALDRRIDNERENLKLIKASIRRTRNEQRNLKYTLEETLKKVMNKT